MAESIGTYLVETQWDRCVIRLLWFPGDKDPRRNYVDVQLTSRPGPSHKAGGSH